MCNTRITGNTLKDFVISIQTTRYTPSFLWKFYILAEILIFCQFSPNCLFWVMILFQIWSCFLYIDDLNVFDCLKFWIFLFLFFEFQVICFSLVAQYTIFNLVAQYTIFLVTYDFFLLWDRKIYFPTSGS